ncbi:MAG: hypothetical protein HYW48_08265 [Deltaproteobacteria bacterium]|nr:hypothetical protein [Deltaproteobacteria bacterium]
MDRFGGGHREASAFLFLTGFVAGLVARRWFGGNCAAGSSKKSIGLRIRFFAILINMNRREILRLGAGVLLLSGCKTAKEKGGTDAATSFRGAARKDPFAEPVPSEQKSQGPGEDKPTGEKDERECEELTVDLAKFPTAGENMDARMVFYGDSTSTLMVIDLPKYQHGLLKSMIVYLQPSQRVIARRGIFEESDIKDDTTLRPVAIENVPMKGDRKAALIYEVQCDGCAGGVQFLKYEFPTDIVYSTTFLDKPAYGLNPSSMPQLFKNYQTIPLFAQEPEKAVREKVLQLANPLTPYSVSGLDDVYVTDLMGKILSVPGQAFKDIWEYPEFICYRSVKNMFYIRTFVRVY